MMQERSSQAVGQRVSRMRFCQWLSFLCLCAILPAGSARGAGSDRLSPDEELLKSAGLPADGPGLLRFFQLRTELSPKCKRVEGLVHQLGVGPQASREQAAAELVSMGVVVVPFFISDGLHSYEDIPVLLGIADERSTSSPKQKGDVIFRKEPYQIDNRSLFYASSIGTDPRVADIIVEQATAAARANDSGN